MGLNGFNSSFCLLIKNNQTLNNLLHLIKIILGILINSSEILPSLRFRGKRKRILQKKKEELLGDIAVK